MNSNRRLADGPLITRIAVAGLAVLSVSMVWGRIVGTGTLDLWLHALGAVTLLASLLLVRAGRARLARWLLPALAWLLANAAILMGGQTTPFAFVAINGAVLLLAGALLGHRAVLWFTVLSVGSSGLLLALSLAGRFQLIAPPGAKSVTAATVFVVLAILSYYALHSRQRALERASRLAAETENLRQATAAVTSSLRQEETIDRILVALADVISYDSAAVQILEGNELKIIGGRGWEDPNSVVGIRFPIGGDNPNTVVVNRRQPHILDDAQAAHATFHRPPHNHIRSWLGVPLMVGQRLIGMLSIDHSEPGRYGPREAELATAFGAQVAVALENARHFRAEQRRRQIAAMQQDITQVSSSSLELHEVLTRVARLTAEATGARRCAVLLIEDEDGQLRLANVQTVDPIDASLDSQRLESAYRLLADRYLPEERAGMIQARLLDRSDLAAGLAPDLLDALDSQQALLAPLISRGHFIGLLVLDRQPAGRAFDQELILLVQSVSHGVAASIENALLYARMEEMATTDTLTGLYNRRGLAQLAHRELDRCQRYGRSLSVLMLDLDHFKRLNDSHGHLAGDQVLVGLGRRLESSLRRTDLLGRHGGEELVAVLPECDLASAERAAERLRRDVEVAPFPTHAGPLEITVSIGVANSDDVGMDLDLLVDAADQAMYAAKQAGRNRVWSLHQGRPRPSNADS